jgi:hypothetical protein
MRRLLIIVLLAMATQSAVAQQETEAIIVTGSRIDGDEYSEMPAITLIKQADFLVKSAHLTNDTRDAAARAEELYQTIKALLDAAKGRPGYALGYGGDFLIPITDDNYRIPLRSEDGGRPDTSWVDLYVKVALTPESNVAQTVTSLTEFIKAAKVTGRTLVTSGEQVSLSLVTPEKYRLEIVKKIVDDVAILRGTVGANCKIKISGLENRVMWTRTDVSELTLYIPHKIEMSECG